MLRPTPSARHSARKVKYELSVLQSRILKAPNIDENENGNIGSLTNFVFKTEQFLRTNWYFFISNLLLLIAVFYIYSSGMAEREISNSQVSPYSPPTHRINVPNKLPFETTANTILGRLRAPRYKPVFPHKVSTPKALIRPGRSTMYRADSP